MNKLLLASLALAAMIAFVGYRSLADDAKPAAPAADTKVLADFENPDDVRLARGGDDWIKSEIVADHATSGTHSMKFTSAKGNDYCIIDIVNDAVKGWDKDKYKYIAVDFTTDQDVNCASALELRPASVKAFSDRADLTDGVPAVKKGKVTVYAALADFKYNNTTNPFDLTKLTVFRIRLDTKDMKEDLVTYMDNVRLTNEQPK
jgi:hypothetical protein